MAVGNAVGPHWTAKPIAMLAGLATTERANAVEYLLKANRAPLIRLSVSKGMERPRRAPLHMRAMCLKRAEGYEAAIVALRRMQP